MGFCCFPVVGILERLPEDTHGLGRARLREPWDGAVVGGQGQGCRTPRRRGASSPRRLRQGPRDPHSHSPSLALGDAHPCSSPWHRGAAALPVPPPPPPRTPSPAPPRCTPDLPPHHPQPSLSAGTMGRAKPFHDVPTKISSWDSRSIPTCAVTPVFRAALPSYGGTWGKLLVRVLGQCKSVN